MRIEREHGGRQREILGRLPSAAPSHNVRNGQRWHAIEVSDGQVLAWSPAALERAEKKSSKSLH